MNNFKLVITSDMLKEVKVPLTLVSSISLVVIIITIVLVKKQLKRRDKNEKN